MVQPINFEKPVYNAVNINIRKPEVDAKSNVSNPMVINNDNGIYNAVKINIDNPKVNTDPKPIYEYPEASSVMTYNMLTFNPIVLPEKVENNPVEKVNENQEVVEEAEAEKVPAPNYTTVEAEKEEAVEKKTPESISKLSFRANEAKVKKPEIIPSEPILPNVDIALVTANLESENKDVQAQQIEEIVRTSIMEPEKAKDYLISDIFAKLINITKEDATKQAPPSQKQIELRQKLIANIMAVETNKNAVNNLPYKLSEEEVAVATALSPMELTERNKEYAITALGSLAKVFIEDYQAKEGRIIPITDVPGVSAIVNALREDPDSGVKLASIDALRLVAQPEYKEELSALFTLAKTDPNPAVSKMAEKALSELN